MTAPISTTHQPWIDESECRLDDFRAQVLRDTDLADYPTAGDVRSNILVYSAHAHLKDVDAVMAARVQAGELSHTEAVRHGMYTPLGSGDVDIAGIVATLRNNGFDGWFVMEQGTILDGEPTDEGPVRDVRTSAAFMDGVCRVPPSVTV